MNIVSNSWKQFNNLMPLKHRCSKRVAQGFIWGYMVARPSSPSFWANFSLYFCRAKKLKAKTNHVSQVCFLVRVIFSTWEWYNFIVLRIAPKLVIHLDNRAGMIGTSWEKDKGTKVRNVGKVYLASFVGSISGKLKASLEDSVYSLPIIDLNEAL